MKGPKDGVDFTLSCALTRADAVIQETRRLSTKDFPFSLPHELLKLMGQWAAIAREDLANLRHDQVFLDARTPLAERIESIRILAAKVRWVHSSLSVLMRVDSSRLPFELVRALEGLAAELLGVNSVRLILQPVQQYSLQIVPLDSLAKKGWTKPQERPVDGGTGAKDSTRHSTIQPSLENAFLLSFPSAEPTAFAMHTVFLHELGHPLFKRRHRVAESSLFGTVPKVVKASATKLDKIIKADVELRLKARGLVPPSKAQEEFWAQTDPVQTGRLGPSDPQQKRWNEHSAEELRLLYSQAAKVTLDWAEEVFCDLCALRLVGPAYLAAFQGLIVPLFSSGTTSDSHPAPFLRLRIMQGFLAQESESLPQLKKLCEKFRVEDWLLSIAADTEPSAFPLPHQLAVAAFDSPSELLNALFDAARLVVSPFQTANFLEIVDKAVSQLDSLIPPDPFLHSPDVFSCRDGIAIVFCCAWLFRLSDHGMWSESYRWSEERCREVLDMMALKALETFELRRLYEARKLTIAEGAQ